MKMILNIVKDYNGNYKINNVLVERNEFEFIDFYASDNNFLEALRYVIDEKLGLDAIMIRYEKDGKSEEIVVGS